MPRQELDVKVVECKEYDHIEIEPSLWFGANNQAIFNSEINGKDVLRVSFSGGRLRLQATSFVGVIPINDRVVLRVRPRVPIGNLTRMVIETGHGMMALTALRDYAGRGPADEWVMQRYTDALLDYVDEVLLGGLMREYRQRHDEGHVPRGRVQFTPTIQRFAGRGVPNKAAFVWFERTVDTPTNRCLKAAMNVIHQHLMDSRSTPRKGDQRRIRRLAGQFPAFEEVGDDFNSTYLEDPEVRGFSPLPDSRSYYRPALDLALLIVRGVGIALDLDGSDVRLGSLLVNTNELFEKYVRAVLAKHVRAGGYAVDVLDGNTEGKVDLYDVPDELPAPRGIALPALATKDPGKAQPDLVLRTSDGLVRLVAEVKNTLTSDAALPDRVHVHQAVTYALRYNLSFAVLVHPWSRGTKGLVYVGRIGSVDVYDYRLNLSSDEDIEDAVADMAGALLSLSQISPAQVEPTDRSS